MLFCNHKWTLVSETTTESKFESAVKALGSGKAITRINIPHQLCCADRKFIQITYCDKCGKLKRFVENI